MSNKILVVHGVGMNMRGKAQIDIFGPMTLPEYDEHIRLYAKELDLDVEIFHSNVEGEVINRLYEADEENLSAAIMNPAGYTTGHPALYAAVNQVSYPVWEIHMSNPARRGRISEMANVAQGVITGLGIHGYYSAMIGIKRFANSAG